MKTKEPPSTERYARWCERSANQLMISLLLDLPEKNVSGRRIVLRKLQDMERRNTNENEEIYTDLW